MFQEFCGKRDLESYAGFLAWLACGFFAEEGGQGQPMGFCAEEGVEGRPTGFCAEEGGKRRPDILTVREKELDEGAYVELFSNVWEKCRSLASGHHALLTPHTCLAAARKTGCPRIHLPLRLLREHREAGTLAGIEEVGVSVHSVEEAREAEQLGASYLTAGHIFRTDCKRGAPPRGTAFLEEVCESVEIPVYAIGGIHPETLPEVFQTRAAGACMMSEYMGCWEISR